MKKIDLTYIIDDDTIFVFVLKKLLEKNKIFHEIQDFRNAADVIDILSNLDKGSNYPTIILLDLNMPVIDGWQFLDQMEKMPEKENLNIFIISSSIDSSDIEKSKEYSTVKDFISKPLNNEKLLKIIDKI